MDDARTTTGCKHFELGDLALQGGVTLPNARLAYQTYGTLNARRDNAIVMPTFFGGHHTDTEAMMAPGRALNPGKYFIVVPNMLSNGLSSSPSNTPPPFDRGRFPNVTLYDNVTCQHRLVTEHLGVKRIRLVVGYSMGAQQAFHWGALYPELVQAIAPICGSARTSQHNALALDGVKAALTADAAFSGGDYGAPPVNGQRAFARVYAGWLFSREFFQAREHTKMGFATVEDTVGFLENYFGSRDANDLLAMLWTWQHADLGANPRFGGDLSAALAAMECRAIVMPCATDLYFPVADGELAVAGMPRAELRPIPSTWGHIAGFGANPADNAFVDEALRDLLAA